MWIRCACGCVMYLVFWEKPFVFYVELNIVQTSNVGTRPAVRFFFFFIFFFANAADLQDEDAAVGGCQSV